MSGVIEAAWTGFFRLPCDPSMTWTEASGFRTT
jgi:hypothetical protein